MKIYRDKTILITGHTGFKGSWLSLWLNSLGAKVIGISNDIPSSPSNFKVSNVKDFIEDRRVDVCDINAVKKIIYLSQPDFIFHLASQSLVYKSYTNPLDTISTNTFGTVNILEALRDINKSVVVVMITSDKVYKNNESKSGYSEKDPLGGKDPYSASKGMAEFAISTYVNSYFKFPELHVRLGIARSGNVIGGGDWSTGRIVPDCMKSWSTKKVVDIRNPDSTRPWQHVLETLRGYLVLGRELAKKSINQGEAYNFGPHFNNKNYSVRELIEELSKHWDQVKWNDISRSKENFHEAGLLKLNCNKALQDLKWQSLLSFEEVVKMTVKWYKIYYKDEEASMYDYTIGQINEYMELVKARDFSSLNHNKK